MLNKVPQEAVKPKKTVSKWFHQVNTKLAKLFTRVNDMRVAVDNHETELRVMEGKALYVDERLDSVKDLNRTLTEKIIRLDERLSSLEDKVAHSAATNAIREDLRIYENNTKVFDLIAENQALRSLVKQYEEAYGPIADKNKGK